MPRLKEGEYDVIGAKPKKPTPAKKATRKRSPSSDEVAPTVEKIGTPAVETPAVEVPKEEAAPTKPAKKNLTGVEALLAFQKECYLLAVNIERMPEKVEVRHIKHMPLADITQVSGIASIIRAVNTYIPPSRDWNTVNTIGVATYSDLNVIVPDVHGEDLMNLMFIHKLPDVADMIVTFLENRNIDMGNWFIDKDETSDDYKRAREKGFIHISADISPVDAAWVVQSLALMYGKVLPKEKDLVIIHDSTNEIAIGIHINPKTLDIEIVIPV